MPSTLTCGGDRKAGFIEEIPNEPRRFQVHDLYDHCPEYVRKRMDRELARQQTGKTLSELRAEAGRRDSSKMDGSQTDGKRRRLP